MFRMLCLAALVAFAVPALVHAEEKTHHYAARTPATKKEALAWLNDTAPLQAALKKGDFEAIHQQSYSLEAAVDYLRKLAKGKEQSDGLDTVDEAVQIIHASSETRKKAELEEALPQLQKGAATLRRLMQ